MNVWQVCAAQDAIQAARLSPGFDKGIANWKTMPGTMIRKVALVQASYGMLCYRSGRMLRFRRNGSIDRGRV